MADFRTSGCERFDQKEIVLHLSDAAQMRPTWLLDFFTESVASGRRFQAEETVQIGWMITKLKENPEGDLEVWEPRFGPVPIEWIRGINKTLRHLILQKSVTESFHQEPAFPSILQAGTVTPSFWKSKDSFLISRAIPEANSSGWQFSAQKRNDSDEKLHSLFEIASRVPLIIPFLAMPPGAHAECNEQGIITEYSGMRISSGENKLLKMLHHEGMAEA